MSDPDPRYARGLDVLSSLAGSEEAGRARADVFDSMGALGSIALRTGAGEIWSRPQLSRRDRSLVAITFLTALARDAELRRHIAGGLHHGLTREEIDEIMVQICAYAGVPCALGGAAAAAQVFAELDGTAQRATPPAPAERKSDEKRRADGVDVLRTLVGHLDMDPELAAQATLAQLGDTGKLVLDFAFGEVWARPQLSRRDRSLVVISVLAALSLAHELEIHIQGALNHGVTQEEIEEVMLTLVLYGGFPRAIDGIQLAKKVFAAGASD